MASMADLLASLDGKSLTVNRGDLVRGTVVSVTDTDLFVDLGTKAEGVIDRRELYGDYENLKVGDKIEAYVVTSENDSGQVTLSLERQSGRQGAPQKNWGKFTSAMNQKRKLQGKVLELNRGGVVVDVEGARAFLPTSQLSYASIKRLNDLPGQDLSVVVLEVDEGNNRLIVTDREEASDEVRSQVQKYESGQRVKGKIVAVTNFGVFVDVDGLEGLVFIQEASWDKVDDLSKIFSVGQEVEAVVTGVDVVMGRVNLSIRKLSEDPFSELAEKYQPDDVVKGTVRTITEEGVIFVLEKGLEAIMDKAKVDTTYEPGQQVTVLIDSVDARQRKIFVAPMLTSTSGLIYK